MSLDLIKEKVEGLCKILEDVLRENLNKGSSCTFGQLIEDVPEEEWDQFLIEDDMGNLMYQDYFFLSTACSGGKYCITFFISEKKEDEETTSEEGIETTKFLIYIGVMRETLDFCIKIRRFIVVNGIEKSQGTTMLGNAGFPDFMDLGVEEVRHLVNERYFVFL